MRRWRSSSNPIAVPRRRSTLEFATKMLPLVEELPLVSAMASDRASGSDDASRVERVAARLGLVGDGTKVAGDARYWVGGGAKTLQSRVPRVAASATRSTACARRASRHNATRPAASRWRGWTVQRRMGQCNLGNIRGGVQQIRTLARITVSVILVPCASQLEPRDPLVRRSWHGGHFNGVDSRAARRCCPNTLWTIARRKLDQLDATVSLEALRVPPGNQLEALKGDRRGQYSIRINDHSAFVSPGRPKGRTASRLSTITRTMAASYGAHSD